MVGLGGEGYSDQNQLGFLSNYEHKRQPQVLPIGGNAWVDPTQTIRPRNIQENATDNHYTTNDTNTATNKNAGYGIYQARLRCEMLLLLLRACVCVCVCALCSTAVMRRVSIEATGARCVVRAWGVLCGVRVWRRHTPQSPEY